MKYSIDEAKHFKENYKFLIGKTFVDSSSTSREIEIQYIGIVPNDGINEFFSKCNFVDNREEFIENYPTGVENLAVLLIGYTPINRRWYKHLDEYLKEANMN